MNKAFIFDMDGVLVNSEMVTYRQSQHSLQTQLVPSFSKILILASRPQRRPERMSLDFETICLKGTNKPAQMPMRIRWTT